MICECDLLCFGNGAGRLRKQTILGMALHVFTSVSIVHDYVKLMIELYAADGDGEFLSADGEFRDAFVDESRIS